jgi:hypothetical protein
VCVVVRICDASDDFFLSSEDFVHICFAGAAGNCGTICEVRMEQ